MLSHLFGGAPELAAVVEALRWGMRSLPPLV